MKMTVFRTLLLLLGLLPVIPSCASTDLTAVWKDEAFRDQPRKIMIIGLLPDPRSRFTFEEEMVKSLRKRGTDATASHSLLREEPAPDKEAVEKVMKEQGADAVLIARLVDKKTVSSLVPASPGAAYGAPGYYGAQWHGYYSSNPGTVRTDDFAVVQTNLYDLKTEKLVWTAASETWLAVDKFSLIQSFVDAITKELVREKIIVRGKRN
jgi:hypothetical protein